MLEIKVPSPGESITEVTIESWLKKDGDYVQKDEPLADIQSDKATLTVYAESAGKLAIVAKAGDTIAVGTVIARIDTDAAPQAANGAPAKPEAKPEPKTETKAEPAKAAATTYAAGVPSASAAKIMSEKGISPEVIEGSGKGGRITKADVVTQGAAAKAPAAQPAAQAKPATAAPASVFTGERTVTRQKMTQLRKTLAARLVSVKNETAMLTTFNEADMTAILDLRKKYKDRFKEVHEVGLGFMSFFVKACCMAVADFPATNASIDGDELVYHNYVDMGIAVSTDRGLMVPVVRNAESKSLWDIEKEIAALAERARTGQITIAEMQGGTFTITNGGVFGSLMSTPILNPPQSAILGMHKIQERPVVLNGQVVVRPMMYLALSYDHRVIDGRESVSTLVRIKEYLEDPTRLLLAV
jgi:2-oxoglutarate dehydrogenase E2 component (dihydrolipoamide succinyltransferase)